MAKTYDHMHYLRFALAEAKKSEPKSTNFCVGALLVAPSFTSQPAPFFFEDPHLLVTGYTLECEGNTHAEQSCFIKLAEAWGVSYHDPNVESEPLGPLLPDDTILYTTMEPCSQRSPGNTPCVDRILALKREDGRQSIRTVVVGVQEPDTFVGVNEGKKRLEEAGIEVIHITGLEEAILKVATAGHEK